MGRTDRRGFLRTSLLAAGAAALPARRARAQRRPEVFDYIVIGAGSAGCVLANRLSADPAVRVLVIEAGGPVSDAAVAAPGRWVSLIGGPLDWKYATEPEPALGGRRIGWPRGKAYGGSSTISAMSYLRGHRLSFDAWARAAGPSWSYAELLPYFRKSERNTRGASDYHGAEGPWWVADTTDPHAGHLAFLDAARSLGFDARPDWDLDGPRQENAAAFYQKHFVNGRRQSVADAFLTPALARPNLVVWPRTVVARLAFTGFRATGVEVIRDGRADVARAGREVIVAAGAIESPKILLLSGLGPAADLRRHGIEPRVDLPGVGGNLQDNPRVTVRWQGRQALPGSTVSAGLLTWSGVRPGGPPDIQFYVGRGVSDPDPFITLTVALTVPESRGAITLASADPVTPPRIQAGYLTSARDVDALVEAVRLARSLAGAPAYEALRGAPILPAPGVRTPEELRAFIRATTDTMFHPTGSCRMGTDAGAVVDPQLRVRGVEGLRVADASVMPVGPNCQCNAAVVAIAERAAALLGARS